MRALREHPGPSQISVWDFPRPPALVDDRRKVVVMFAGEVIAETTRALTIRETSHPPTWYLPLPDIRRDLLRPADGSSFCEWKGAASYVDIVAGGLIAAQAGWYYAEPADAYERLREHVAFYAGRVHRVTVNGIEVEPQPGGFYGGWITPDVVGPFKGDPGSGGW